MRFLLGMCALITLPLWASTQVTTRIHDIDHGDHITDEALVFLASGQVAKINVNNSELLKQLNESVTRRTSVTVELDENREIMSVTPVTEKSLMTEEPIPTPVPAPVIQPETEVVPTEVLPESEILPVPVEPTPAEEPLKVTARDPLEGYNSSVASEDMAKKMFSDMRRWSKEETQCFNRAMVWTYEWRVKRNFYSKKIWIFFTRKFIRRHNFEWWFHVAPMINVAVEGQIKERIMDKKYSGGPLAPLRWAKIFLRGEKVDCPVVHKYSDHANYPEAGSCFIMKSPMYYYQPVDIEFLEKYGTVLSTWNETNVRQAYAEAFSIYP